MSAMDKIVFLVDVDNTLLDNDSAQSDYLQHIRQHLGGNAAERYWSIFRHLNDRPGYAGFPGGFRG